jgi:hypothetical protein
VELEVLPREVQEVEKPVHYLVLAHSLVPYQQQVFSEREVLQHVLHDVKVLGITRPTVSNGAQGKACHVY